MLPLSAPAVRARPLVTWGLLAANVLAYSSSAGAAQAWGFVPARFVAEPLAALPTIFTSMFLHGGLLHLLGNLWFLYLFGGAVEAALGRARFLAFYLSAGLVAALAQLVSDPSSAVPMIGASGAIAGVLGGFALRYPRAPVAIITPLLFSIELPAFVVVGGWFAIQVLLGISSLGEQAGVAFFAHVGGLVAGVAMMALTPRERPRAVYVLRGTLDDWTPPSRRAPR
ncbi:MAG: rhomboid family intramembrane serine protease [Polyangiaceae bacterium]|nr:rhomboid family intramembrane serine protease [Polyangiaceae bacterium]